MCQINTARAKTRLGNLHVVGKYRKRALSVSECIIYIQQFKTRTIFRSCLTFHIYFVVPSRIIFRGSFTYYITLSLNELYLVVPPRILDGLSSSDMVQTEGSNVRNVATPNSISNVISPILSFYSRISILFRQGDIQMVGLGQVVAGNLEEGNF